MNEGTFSLDFVLDEMRADEERGAYPQLAVHIELYEKSILEEGNDELKAAYLALKARIAAGFEYERKHGKWSLVKSDHPLTLKLRQVNSRAYLRYQSRLNNVSFRLDVGLRIGDHICDLVTVASL